MLSVGPTPLSRSTFLLLLHLLFLVPFVIASSAKPSSRSSPSSSSPSPSPSSPLVFHASQFGALPNDGVDDTAALQAAIDAAIRFGPHTALLLSAGEWNINATLTIANARNFAFTGASASSTLLLVHARSGALYYTNSIGLTLASFSIDFAADYLPFTAGHITNLTTTPPFTLDLLPTQPHTAQTDRTASALFVYDVQSGRPAFGADTYEVFQSVSDVSRLVGGGVVRFAMEGKTAFKMGQAVVVRYDGGPHAISGLDCWDVRLDDITVYASWDMSHASNRIHNLHVSNYHVKKREGRWLSTNADANHMGDCRGRLAWVNSSFEGMGDDGLNVHSYFFNTTAIINATTVVLSLLKNTGWLDTLNVGVGSSMTFSHAATPYVPYAQYQIAALHQHSASSYQYTFTTTIHPATAVSDWCYVSNSPSLLLSNVTIAHNRARGVLLETHNVTIERSLFRFTSGPALLFQPSAYWGEAEEGANVTVVDSVFEGCNEGIAQQEGVIALLPDPVQSMGVINTITIHHNTFLQSAYSRAILQDWNGVDVTLHSNYIANLTAATAPITVCNSRSLAVRHNSASWADGGREGAADYVLDGPSGVCNASLSAGLGCGRDAFNASFGPHVWPATSGYGVVIVGMGDDGAVAADGDGTGGRDSGSAGE